MNRLFLVGVVVILFVATVGCGNQMPTLSGRVTLDGNPPPDNPPPNNFRGTISFQPVDPGLGTAFAQIKPDGSYEARTGNTVGIKEGRYKVRIAATLGIPAPPPPGQPVKANFWAPLLYNDFDKTPFEVEVKAGSNKADFEMKSKP